MKKPLVAVIGPTSSGKSDVAVEVALNFSGEVVSADSRQVYKGLDLGTGKITEEEMRGVPHFMLDVALPTERYTVQQYKRDAEKVIEEIHDRDNLPILCGGTGFYVSALIDNITFPKVGPDSEFRKECDKEDSAVLFEKLKKKDPKRAEKIDPENKVRVVRALEIVRHFGSVPEVEKKGSLYETLLIGMDLTSEELRDRIEIRLMKRIDSGMIEEAERLHKEGLSFDRMEELGLEYRFLARHLKGEISKSEMIEEIEKASIHYVKRQKTWFKRDDRIDWFHPTEIKSVLERVNDFVKVDE